jgi:hypothetical protein
MGHGDGERLRDNEENGHERIKQRFGKRKQIASIIIIHHFSPSLVSTAPCSERMLRVEN